MPADIVDLEKAKRGRPKPEPMAEWKRDMVRGGKNNAIRGCDANAGHALLHCPELSRKIAFDVRQQRLVSLEETPAGPKGHWTDAHTAALAIWLQRQDVPVNNQNVFNGLSGTIVNGYTIDPLADHLGKLEWDGEPRLATWLADYCGAERSPANSIMGRKFLIGMAARGLRPGCKMDNMLLFEGDQGRKKSWLIKIFGAEWVAENIADFHSKDAMLTATSHWVIEVAELAALGRSTLRDLKSFVSRTHHTLRLPYGRLQATLPCWCVYWGNYNPDGTGVLEDPTGARRFWPVTVGMIDLDAVAKDRDQLVAEAVAAYIAEEPWWIENDEDQAFVAEQQQQRHDGDDWLTAIEKFVTLEPGTGMLRPSLLAETTTSEVLQRAVGLVTKDIGRAEQRRAANCLKELGYKRSKKWGKKSSSRIFVLRTDL